MLKLSIRKIKNELFSIMLLVLFSTSTNAALITWTLDDWVFDDGGAAVGSFMYDEDSNVYSEMNIQTTAGQNFAGALYQISGIFGSAASIDAVSFAQNEDATNTPTLFALLDAPMTNAGGRITVTLAPFASNFEGVCSNFDCSDGAILRTLVSGSVLASSVSAPSISLFFLMGLISTVLIRRRRSML